MKTTLLLLLAPLAKAFVVVPRRTLSRHRLLLKTAAATTTSVEDDDALLDRIQHEYKQLQEKLLRDLVVVHDNEEAEQIEEEMVEKAVQAASVIRYKQMKVLDEAEKEMKKALGDIEQARALKDQVHDEAIQAEKEATLLESIDAQYEDMERVRDQAVVHADRQLEEDADILEMQSEYHRELAEGKEQRAARILKQVQEYEARLKQALKEMRELKTGKPLRESMKAEAAKHKRFLDEIQATIDSDEALLSSLKKSAQEKWKEEAAHRNAMEHSVETDPDLSAVLEHKEPVQKTYMEKESHKHDSMLNEIEHSIDVDPDLSNIAHQKEEKEINREFVQHEAHKHDSLLEEIEHSIDTDPDLA